MGKFRSPAERQAERAKYIHTLAGHFLGWMKLDPTLIVWDMFVKLRDPATTEQKTMLIGHVECAEDILDPGFPFAHAFYVCYGDDVMRFIRERLSPETRGRICFCGPRLSEPGRTDLYDVRGGSWYIQYESAADLLEQIAQQTIVAAMVEVVKPWLRPVPADSQKFDEGTPRSAPNGRRMGNGISSVRTDAASKRDAIAHIDTGRSSFHGFARGVPDRTKG